MNRDGIYVMVQPSGTIAFHLDYGLKDRRERIILRRYGFVNLSLARASEASIDAKRLIAEGRSPAQAEQREKRRLKEAKSFGEFGER